MKRGYARSFVIVVGAFALLVASAQIAFAESGSNYAGRFKGDKLAAEFLAAGDGTFTGTLYMRAGQFPLKAHVANGQLQGTFTANGTDFPFTAQLDGANLSLTSGATTYTLNKLAVNPLGDDTPAAPTPTAPLAPDAPAVPTPPDASAGNSGDAAALFAQGQTADGKHDYVTAADLYRKAAALGSLPAMDDLGYLYQQGAGVDQDYGAAMNWYRKAADGGNGPAMGDIGWLYANGLGVTVDYAQALAWYIKAADAGHASSMNKIGLIYLNGNGVDKDPAKAVEWFRKAADRGDTDGLFDMGYAYENGTGVAKDYAQALQWYRKVADTGSGNAMNKIGLFYLNGSGVDKDPVAAAGWFRKAADAGDPNGLFDVAYCYENGVGVTKDFNAAVDWYKKSAAAGCDDAKKWLAANTGAQPAAGAQNSGDVHGTWAIDGDLGGEKFTVTFANDGTVTVEDKTSGSSAGGSGFKVNGNAIVFDGSNSMNSLTVGGTWKVQWLSADSFKATDDNGKAYMLMREAVK